MQWIKISEKQPEFDVPVLVADGKFLEIARMYQKTETKDSIFFEFHSGYSGHDDTYFTVKYWMPIPAVPPVPTQEDEN